MIAPEAPTPLAIATGGVGVPDAAFGADPTVSKIKPQPSYPPNPTLYLSNIDWSIKKPLLKRCLLALFSRHGKVLDVVCLRGDARGGRPLRGQAWVIFETLSAATAALGAERGFVLFGRPLMVNYARTVSDRIAKREGTYAAKTKERRAAKRKVGEEDDISAAEFSKGEAINLAVTKEPTSILREPSITAPPPSQPTAGPAVANQMTFSASSTPSSVLMAKNLPSECNGMMLAMLFRQYSGYREVKSWEGGAATIEFGTENDATSALKGLNGFKLTTSASLELTYGERQ